MNLVLRCFLALLVVFFGFAHADEDDESRRDHTGLFVNGKELTFADVTELESRYGIKILDAKLSRDQTARLKAAFGVDVDGGKFWYDVVSGAWGYVGLPTAGRILPNLPFAAELAEDASGGGSDVVVNGRILHPAEVNYLLKLYGQVTPGRYWLLPDGTYGLEGQGPMGRLTTNAPRGGVTGSGMFGTVIGGDGITGYLPPRGWGDSDTPMVTCGPDGGCIY